MKSNCILTSDFVNHWNILTCGVTITLPRGTVKTNQNKKTIKKAVKLYYGKIALADEIPDGCGCMSEDALCCQPPNDQPLNIGTKSYAEETLENLSSDITNLSLGCGDPVAIASLEPGQTVVDLGSGGGMDCFLAAAQVGQAGKVIGIDMTPEMIARARSNQEKLGITNVEFRQAAIEDIPLKDNSVDVIISNCVINLSADKQKVFQEAFRILKPGGKLVVSDIVIDGHLPESIVNDLSAWASCLAGALTVDELVSLLENSGFVEIRVQPYPRNSALVDPNTNQDPSQCNHANKSREDAEISDHQSAVFSAMISAVKPLTNHE